MGYLDKSLENEKVAKELEEKNYYDGAINRYYYSIFQLILHILDKKGIEINKSDINNASSHDKAIEGIQTYLKGKSASNWRKCGKIKSAFRDIKKHRKLADYEEERASENHIKNVKSKYNELKNLLNAM